MQLILTLLAEVIALSSLTQMSDVDGSDCSPTINNDQEIDCSDHVEMTGVFHVGSRGYFERSECEERFALRFANRDLGREFGRRWSEAYVNGVWTIDMKLRGYVTEKNDRFSRRIYFVESVIYPDAKTDQ